MTEPIGQSLEREHKDCFIKTHKVFKYEKDTKGQVVNTKLIYME